MKFPIKTTIAIVVLGGVAALAYPSISAGIAERNKPRWRTAKPERGTLTQTVDATGEVKPVKSVQVGSFVSGPIENLYVEFNQEVKKDEVLAEIDPRLFQANVDRDTASLATRKAEVERVEALLQQARNDEARAQALRERNVDFIAQSELDQVRFNRESLEAQLTIANASVQVAEATLSNSEQNLAYCTITSPEDGMIIDRKVEPGQTLAAQFQTPELFVVGVGMREKMHVFADVDESEIGLIRQADETGQPVTFTVTAYPDDEFEGTIEEVRFSSTETQNVVTYPVVIGSPNPDLKLLPGMTADLSFQIVRKDEALKVPKAALRFFPPSRENVHPDDHELFDGRSINSNATASTSEETETEADAENRKRHVWVVDGELLRAIEVEIGISDTRFTEIISGDITEDTELVTGQKLPGEQ